MDIRMDKDRQGEIRVDKDSAPNIKPFWEPTVHTKAAAICTYTSLPILPPCLSPHPPCLSMPLPTPPQIEQLAASRLSNWQPADPSPGTGELCHLIVFARGCAKTQVTKFTFTFTSRGNGLYHDLPYSRHGNNPSHKSNEFMYEHLFFYGNVTCFYT